MNWVLLDMPNVMARSYYALPPMNRKGHRIEAIYGAMRTIKSLPPLFPKCKMAFCFDSSTSLRERIFPQYKQGRIKDEASNCLWEQKERMRKEILPMLGFANVFCQEGYEADDLIGRLCGQWKEPCVIISTDQDLYQLLEEGRVSQYDPWKDITVTESLFTSRWKIDPRRWAYAKALAGDTSDNIDGVSGVGLKTAIRYLNGKLGIGTKAYKSICLDKEIYLRNLKLVRLPFEGCDYETARPDSLSSMKWGEVEKKLGLFKRR